MGQKGFWKGSPTTFPPVLNFLEYRRSDGAFYWLVSRGRVRRGDRAGTLTEKGYIIIAFMDWMYQAHRLVWFVEKGIYPSMLDHINGTRSDNRIENLRIADYSTNGMNGKTRRVGLKGATWCKRKEMWKSQIKKNYVNYHLGYFGTEKEAHDAYWFAAKGIFGEFASNGERQKLGVDG